MLNIKLQTRPPTPWPSSQRWMKQLPATTLDGMFAAVTQIVAPFPFGNRGTAIVTGVGATAAGAPPVVKLAACRRWHPHRDQHGRRPRRRRDGAERPAGHAARLPRRRGSGLRLPAHPARLSCPPPCCARSPIIGPVSARCRPSHKKKRPLKKNAPPHPWGGDALPAKRGTARPTDWRRRRRARQRRCSDGR
jgi:hypothetical protein